MTRKRRAKRQLRPHVAPTIPRPAPYSGPRTTGPETVQALASLVERAERRLRPSRKVTARG